MDPPVAEKYRASRPAPPSTDSTHPTHKTKSEADEVFNICVATAMSQCHQTKQPRGVRVRDRRCRHSVELVPYRVNSAYQSRITQPRARAYGYADAWAAEAEAANELLALAVSIVKHFVACVRLGDDDIACGQGIARLSPTTFIASTPDWALVHVWQSKRQALLFHEALRRQAQARFESLVPTPLHGMLAALVTHQATLVSVVFLPPLYSDVPIVMERKNPTWFALDVWRCAMHLPRHASLPLQLGADARYYLAAPPTLVCHHDDPHEAAIEAEPNRRSSLLRGDVIAGLVNATAPLVVTVSLSDIVLVARKVAMSLVRLFEVPDAERTPAIRNLNTTIVALYGQRAISTTIHNGGLPLRHIGMIIHALHSSSDFNNLDMKPWVDAVMTALHAEMVGRTIVAVARGKARTALNAASGGGDESGRMAIEGAVQDVFAGFLGKAAFFDDVIAPALRMKFFASEPRVSREPVTRAAVKICLQPIMRFAAMKLGFALTADCRSTNGCVTTGRCLSTFGRPAMSAPNSRSALLEAIVQGVSAKAPRAARVATHFRHLLCASVAGDADIITAAYQAADHAFVALEDPNTLRLDNALAEHVLLARHMMVEAVPATAVEGVCKALLLLHEHGRSSESSAAVAPLPTPLAGSKAALTPSNVKSPSFALAGPGGSSASLIIVTNADDASMESSGSAAHHHSSSGSKPNSKSALTIALRSSSCPSVDYIFVAARLFTMCSGLLSFGFSSNAKETKAKQVMALAARLLRCAVDHLDRGIQAAHFLPAPSLIPTLTAMAQSLEAVAAATQTKGLSVKSARDIAFAAVRTPICDPEAVSGSDADGWHIRVLRAFGDAFTADLEDHLDTKKPLTLGLDARSAYFGRSSHDGSSCEGSAAGSLTPMGHRSPNRSPATSALTPTSVAVELPQFALSTSPSLGAVPDLLLDAVVAEQHAARAPPKGVLRRQRIPDVDSLGASTALHVASVLGPAALALARQDAAAVVVPVGAKNVPMDPVAAFYFRCVAAAVVECRAACIDCAVVLSSRTGRTSLARVDLGGSTVGIAGLLAAKRRNVSPPPAVEVGGDKQASAALAQARTVVLAALARVADIGGMRFVPQDAPASTWTSVALLLRLLANVYPRFDVVMEMYTAIRAFIVRVSNTATAEASFSQLNFCLAAVHRSKVRFIELIDPTVNETRTRVLMLHTEDIGFRTLLRMHESVTRDVLELEFTALHRQWRSDVLEPYCRSVVSREEQHATVVLAGVMETTLRDVLESWEQRLRGTIIDACRESHSHAYLLSTVGVAAKQMLDDDGHFRTRLLYDAGIESRLVRLELDEAVVRHGLQRDIIDPAFFIKILPEWSITMWHWYWHDFRVSLRELLAPVDASFRASLEAEETRRRTTITQLCAMGPSVIMGQRPQAVTAATTLPPPGATPAMPQSRASIPIATPSPQESSTKPVAGDEPKFGRRAANESSASPTAATPASPVLRRRG